MLNGGGGFIGCPKWWESKSENVVVDGAGEVARYRNVTVLVTTLSSLLIRSRCERTTRHQDHLHRTMTVVAANELLSQSR